MNFIFTQEYLGKFRVARHYTFAYPDNIANSHGFGKEEILDASFMVITCKSCGAHAYRVKDSHFYYLEYAFEDFTCNEIIMQDVLK